MQEAAPVAEEGAGPGPSSERASPATNSKVKPDMLDSAGVPVLVVGGLVFGVLNRVLYKVALVPLRDYTYFLSQFNTLAYLAVYFAALGTRRRVGLVTDEMLAIPRARLWLVGALDAVGLLIGMVGAASLPGVVLPLVGQTAILWQVLFAQTLLQKRFSLTQYLGVLAVVGGVLIVGWPSKAPSALQVPLLPAALVMASMAFPALSSVVKEGFFKDAQAKLGRNIDIFVVNSYSSLAQATFTLLLLPVMNHLRGLTLADLPGYVTAGIRCFAGLDPACPATPLVPLLYVAANLAMNVTLLATLRKSGALVVSLVMSCVVPLTVLAFTFPIPLLGPSPALGPQFFAGGAALLAGLVLYNWQSWSGALGSTLKPAKAV